MHHFSGLWVQMESKGGKVKETQDGHFCPFLALSLSSHLSQAASLPNSQPFSASSLLTQNRLLLRGLTYALLKPAKGSEGIF